MIMQISILHYYHIFIKDKIKIYQQMICINIIYISISRIIIIRYINKLKSHSNINIIIFIGAIFILLILLSNLITIRLFVDRY